MGYAHEKKVQAKVQPPKSPSSSGCYLPSMMLPAHPRSQQAYSMLQQHRVVAHASSVVVDRCSRHVTHPSTRAASVGVAGRTWPARMTVPMPLVPLGFGTRSTPICLPVMTVSLVSLYGTTHSLLDCSSTSCQCHFYQVLLHRYQVHHVLLYRYWVQSSAVYWCTTTISCSNSAHLTRCCSITAMLTECYCISKVMSPVSYLPSLTSTIQVHYVLLVPFIVSE